MFTWSESPSKDMWEHLKFLGNKNNCINLLNGSIKSERTIIYNETNEFMEKKADQIAMCINQAFEYFEAADKVSIRTSPVLLFYGMLSLAKAVIVANEKTIFVEDINYHGLHTRPRNQSLQQYKNDRNSWEIEKEFSVTDKGVFKYLTNIFDSFMFPDGSFIFLKDMLSVCPEVHNIYEKYYGEPARILALYSLEESNDPNYKMKISSYSNDAFIRFPEMTEHFDLEADLLHGVGYVFSSKSTVQTRPDYLGVYEPYVGGRYVVGGLKFYNEVGFDTKYLSPVTIDYLAMHTLSIVARYKQDFWGSIISGHDTGSISLISLYLSVVKRRFPNAILEKMFGEEFGYGIVSRWL
ncbi:YaaC family protein [Tumebacillus permanentifrigoris]|uniref:YaaC-like protein n=1 Tax=Tumebacillus permanentifrigoris TaxID=378543 RepID=A0A316DC94_9BACL|nr:YaaC family protein [Tumebacillus permanentifrigoris]PWK15767.1 YaaC-like protein [Tumebacillus permanentifrigoris]